VTSTAPADDEIFQFPCDFPIKVMGLNDDDFDSLVVTIVRRHAPDLSEGAVGLRTSRNGKYLAVSIVVRATSRQQLDRIYRELSAHERVMMVF